jgi:arginine decarboxylase
LAQRARAEAIYLAISRKVQALLRQSQRLHHEVLERVNEKLADKYFVNFSLFQSIPDVWAIDQIFPVMPLHRLNEPPLRRVVLEDITCDSDGRIDDYVDSEGIETSLPLHAIRLDEEYLLGIFLVGAYQEILGDMHNLFGDTDSINVMLKADGSYQYSQPLQGDTVDSVLRYVHFNPDELLEQYRAKLELAELSETQQQQYWDELGAGLHGYTYLED